MILKGLSCDPKEGGKLIGHPAGKKLWGRKYRKGWKPKVWAVALSPVEVDPANLDFPYFRTKE